MRLGLACLGMAVVWGVGCDSPELQRLLGETAGGGPGGAPVTAPAPGGTGGAGGHPSGCCLSPRPMGGAPGTGSAGETNAAGGSGSGSSDGAAPGGDPVACSSFTVGSTLTLAPAAAGQAYVRCGTLGPEQAWSVVASPSGDRLVARTGAGTIRLISTATWTELAQLAAPMGYLDAAAFSPDGAHLATLASEMGEVTLWRAQDGAFERSFAGPPASTIGATGSSLAFSSDGSRLATSLGTVIDLTTGTVTDWTTGAPDTTTLQANAVNLGDPDAGGVSFIRWTAGDTKLFIVTRFQIGNSPTSIRLELRDPATGQQILLFQAYDRALLGYAISDDGRYVALDGTQEAASAFGLYKVGLTVVDATLGTQVAADPTATSSQVLAFSHDGTRLFIQNGSIVSGVGTTDLQPASSFTWPAGTMFVGLSPQNFLAGTDGTSTTSLFQPVSGAVVHSFAFPTTSVAWTTSGRFAVGNGDPAALFHFWRDADQSSLCGPPAGTGSAPALASLGTLVQTQFGPGSVSTPSADGSVTATESFLIHDHSQNYYDIALTDSASGSLLRQFGAFPDQIRNTPMALSDPSASTVYTPVFTRLFTGGNDVAAWCR